MKITYQLNSELRTLKSDWKGNPMINGIFVNGTEAEQPKSFWEVLKWKMSNNPQSEEKKKEQFRLKVVDNQVFAKKYGDMIVWLGHSCFFIRIGNISMLTDPCLGNLPFIPRQAGLPCQIADLVDIDYILLSHGHRDHFDKPSLKQILKHNPEAEFLVPLGMGELLASIGVQKYQEAGWWQAFRVAGNLDIHFLPAKHWNRRGLLDFNDMLWGSFYIAKQHISIYFAADTAYGSHFKEIQEYYGEFEHCMMPIGAYKPAYFMTDAHISPQYAVTAFNELNAKNFIPMHYGTYDLSDEPLGEPIQLMQEAKAQKLLQGSLQELAIGQEYLI